MAKRLQQAEKHPALRKAEGFEQMAENARVNGDARKQEYYVHAAATARQELAAATALTSFDDDARVVSAKANVAFLQQKGAEAFPGVDDLDLQRAQAVFDVRHSFGTPEKFLAAYNGIIDDITSRSRNHLLKVAGDAEVDAAGAMAKAAGAKVAVVEAQLLADSLVSPDLKEGLNG